MSKFKVQINDKWEISNFKCLCLVVILILTFELHLTFELWNLALILSFKNCPV